MVYMALWLAGISTPTEIYYAGEISYLDQRNDIVYDMCIISEVYAHN